MSAENLHYLSNIPQDFLNVIFTNAEELEHIVTIIAIIVGAAWTYFAFIKKRISFPSLRMRLSATPIKVAANKWLIPVRISLENTGNVVVTGKKSHLRFQKISDGVKYLDEKTVGHATEARTPRARMGDGTFEWVDIHEIEFNWEPGSAGILKIEPGELDVTFEYFCIQKIPKFISVVYYFENERLGEIGWLDRRIYEFDGKEFIDLLEPSNHIDS